MPDQAPPILETQLQKAPTGPTNTDPLRHLVREGGMLAGHPVHFFDTVDSTSTVARELLRQGAPAGTVVLAESQTAGRGRLARQWLSPQGCGLYFSLLVRPALPFAELPRFTLAAGLALCRALAPLLPVSPQLKWPNDLLLHGRKCGGILVELESDEGGGDPWLIVGIGLNVSTPAAIFPEELRDRVTSLATLLDPPPDRRLILEAILFELDRVSARLEAGDFVAILEEWRALDAFADKELTWLTPDGRVVSGISLGPDQEGRLLIREPGGTIHEVLSGDVSLATGFQGGRNG